MGIFKVTGVPLHSSRSLSSASSKAFYVHGTSAQEGTYTLLLPVRIMTCRTVQCFSEA